MSISRRYLIGLPARLGSAWLSAHLPAILAAQEHAHRAAQSAPPVRLGFFSREQAAEVEAVAAQIIPTDDSPGAREAGVIYFIDRALTTFESDKQRDYAEGLAQLQAQVKEKFPTAGRFSDLRAPQQIEFLKSIEKGEFFGLIRRHTIMGFLGNPEYGGNRDQAGWKLIGFEDRFAFEPPFGYYDANNKEER